MKLEVRDRLCPLVVWFAFLFIFYSADVLSYFFNELLFVRLFLLVLSYLLAFLDVFYSPLSLSFTPPPLPPFLLPPSLQTGACPRVKPFAALARLATARTCTWVGTVGENASRIVCQSRRQEPYRASEGSVQGGSL